MKILMTAIIAANLTFAANAATKIVTTNKDGKITTTITRDYDSLTPVVRHLRDPAPANACDTPTRSAFEIVSKFGNKCVGYVTR